MLLEQRTINSFSLTDTSRESVYFQFQNKLIVHIFAISPLHYKRWSFPSLYIHALAHTYTNILVCWSICM